MDQALIVEREDNLLNTAQELLLNKKSAWGSKPRMTSEGSNPNSSSGAEQNNVNESVVLSLHTAPASVGTAQESPTHKGVKKGEVRGSSTPSPHLLDKPSSRPGRRGSLTPAATPNVVRTQRMRKRSLNTAELLARSNFELPESLLREQVPLRSPARGRPGHRKTRRSVSVPQELVLDAAALHTLHGSSLDMAEEGLSRYESAQSVSGSPSVTIKGVGKKRQGNPSLLITYSPTPSQSCEGMDSIATTSQASSVYHSSCLFPPEASPVLPLPKSSRRASTNDVMRRMSSPAVIGGRHKASSNMELATLHGWKGRSFQDLSGDSHTRVKVEGRRSSLPYVLPSVKQARGSIDSQNPSIRDSGTDTKPENTGLEQDCRSKFGIVFSILSFLLVLWYLGMVYSVFINGAMSYESLGILPPPPLDPVQEVVVFISEHDLNNTNTLLADLT